MEQNKSVVFLPAVEGAGGPSAGEMQGAGSAAAKDPQKQGAQCQRSLRHPCQRLCATSGREEVDRVSIEAAKVHRVNRETRQTIC